MHAKTVLLLMSMTASATHSAWIRWNQAGYCPGRPVDIVVMSDTDIAGQSWNLTQGTTAVRSGTLETSFAGIGDHTPKPYNYQIPLGDSLSEGEYVFTTADAAAKIHIAKDPYSVLATQALRHLRVVRSGNEGILLHAPSHLGDSAAPVWTPSGAISQGSWKAASPDRTVDVSGGHYDAGDYIKFTLNEAYLAYHLLSAYQASPEFFAKVYSQSSLPDILDEARYSLVYLMKVFPDSNTFIIQVGDGDDHSQGHRLPENDPLNGKRPALSALSRAHMGVTAAALSLGARVFSSLGHTSEAEQYRAKAIAIYARARSSDAIASAFYRDPTNDFYHDATDADNMALGAAELYALTGDSSYLNYGTSLAPPAESEVSWTSWNFAANHALGRWDAGSQSRAVAESEVYHSFAAGHPWGIPGVYVWGALHRWIGAANATERTYRRKHTSATDSVFLNVLDYTFGRNPWGVSFLASRDLPNAVQNIYAQIYPLLDQFPTGALSEGPGDKAGHDALSEYFTIPANDTLGQFNTSAAVFYDNGQDFMLQEATIGGQADLLLMLALASDSGIVAPADSGSGGGSTVLIPSDTSRGLIPANLSCSVFDDRGEGGVSTTSGYAKTASTLTVTLSPRSGGTVEYPYAGVDCGFSTGLATPYDGVLLSMDLPAGRSVRVSFPQSDILDYGYYGKDITGRGADVYWIPFSGLAQEFGASVPFAASKLTGIDLTATVPGMDVPIAITSLEFRGDDILSFKLRPLDKESPRAEATTRFVPSSSRVELHLPQQGTFDAQGRNLGAVK